MDRDLGKFSDEQLCSMAASGDDSAMAELISRITPLAGAKAAMYNNGDIHRDDLFQEGMIAFITAVNTYDPKKTRHSEHMPPRASITVLSPCSEAETHRKISRRI